MKETIPINFLEKGASLISDSYCQLLKQYFTLFIERLSFLYFTAINYEISTLNFHLEFYLAVNQLIENRTHNIFL